MYILDDIFESQLTLSLGGLFCGMIGAIHSVVGELSDKTNQSTAFPLYDIISALGFVIGCALTVPCTTILLNM